MTGSPTEARCAPWFSPLLAAKGRRASGASGGDIFSNGKGSVA
jgi:hypothetical protein